MKEKKLEDEIVYVNFSALLLGACLGLLQPTTLAKQEKVCGLGVYIWQLSKIGAMVLNSHVNSGFLLEIAET